jgi:dolichyl-diphosphooligosaccharide--protein glycosyltransferase
LRATIGQLPSRLAELVDEVRPSMSMESLVKLSALSLILLVVAIVRLLPLRYGAYINEFDPYLQYYSAEYIADHATEKGLAGLFDYFEWHNPTTWYPEGVDMTKTYFPGVPFSGAIVYLILGFLGVGVDLKTVVIYFPIMTSVISTFIVYLIGRKVGGDVVGMLAALFFGISPAFILRTSLGFFDTETVGMMAMLASIYFYLEATTPRHGLKKQYLLAFLTGLSAGLMAASWGGFLYLSAMLSIFALVIAVLGYQTKDFEKVNALVLLTTVIIASSVPRYGLSFMRHPVSLLLYVAVVVPFAARYLDFSIIKMKPIFVVASLLFLGLIATQVVSVLPLGISERYLAVVNPLTKSENPLVQSVQEHAGAGIASFFFDFGLLIPFMVYGFYLSLRETDRYKLFLLFFSLSSLYFASSFARLGILAAPFLALIGSYGLGSLLNSSHQLLAGGVEHPKKGGVGEEYRTYVLTGLVVILLFVSYFSYDFARKSGNVPTSIAAAGTGLVTEIDDWLEALEWMRDNVPKDAVVAAWWDYGYWISVAGGKNSLADNGTMNSTRIEQLATMFLSNETEALEILRQLDADYVLVFVTSMPLVAQEDVYYCLVQCGPVFGEETKFLQMANIAGLPQERYMNLTYSLEGYGHLFPAFWETFLGKLFPFEFVTDYDYGGRTIDLYSRQAKYPTEPDGEAPLILVYDSPQESIAEVIIYKVTDAAGSG